ncbi:AAA family ATPase [bacterium]|nr:AAA family ATPase [bacterium]
MECQNCHQRPATVHIRQHVNGVEQSLDLCHHCASAMQSAIAGGAAAFGGLESLFESLFGPKPRGRDAMLSRLSEESKQILQRAAQTALSWGHDQITTEFLLLGLAQEPGGAQALLNQAGLSAEGLEARFAEVLRRSPPIQATRVGLAARVKRVLEIALMQSAELGHGFITPLHLLLGLLLEGESYASQLLVGARLDPEDLHGKLTAMPYGNVGDANALPPNLTRFSRDLTALAESGKLDPIIGRDKEIQRVIRILSRKTKNNPVLIGEPGVGKTAIAEGLALRISSGEVPDLLRGRRVLALDLGGMIAGTKFRGEFEERLKGLVDEIRALQGKIILFIDELHTLVGAGAAEGAVDAANMLKPALSRGEMQCVGATTLDEYRKHIEKDAALERRFQPVLVAEPTTEQAVEILRGLRDSYEAHHRVKIADEAIVAAVDLADKYVSDRFLPDKAIDLLDEAAAMERLESRTGSDALKNLEARLAQLEQEKQAAVTGERYEDAARLKAEIETHKAKLDALKRDYETTRGTTEPIVTADSIATVVSEWTGIPASKLASEEKERLLQMEATIQRRVIGQQEAIRAVSEAVRRARAGLKDPTRPIGSFIFLGPTGVGKTETARALADYLFNDEQAMLRFDMSEYMEKHTVSRLIGAPPGYVGYEEAGQLSEAVRRRPYSVVLFDEIEKAHPDVFNILLQILDDGRLTDSQGHTVDFKNTVVIMTSNVGAAEMFKGATLGFRGTPPEEVSGPGWERIREAVLSAMKETFRPEFLNRIDEIVIFQPLSREQILEIVDLLLEATRRKLHGQAISLDLTPAAKVRLAELGYDPTFGARPLRRAIARQLETPLSQLILKGEFGEGDAIKVDVADGHFTFFKEPREARATPER